MCSMMFPLLGNPIWNPQGMHCGCSLEAIRRKQFPNSLEKYDYVTATQGVA